MKRIIPVVVTIRSKPHITLGARGWVRGVIRGDLPIWMKSRFPHKRNTKTPIKSPKAYSNSDFYKLASYTRGTMTIAVGSRSTRGSCLWCLKPTAIARHGQRPIFFLPCIVLHADRYLWPVNITKVDVRKSRTQTWRSDLGVERRILAPDWSV